MKYLGAFVLVLILLFIFFNFLSSPFSTDTTEKDFVVNQGEGAGLIATRLAKNKLIRNNYVFLINSHLLGLNNNLKAGSFKLSPSMSSSEIAVKLSTGGNQDYWLKIIEGQRIAELTEQFDITLEGYIFPDSYLIPRDYTQNQILSVIKKNFDKKFAQAKLDSSSSLTDSQIIILASILEREARTLDSKQHIAGILLNRLSINMALQIDATIQYARDSRIKPKVYWTPVTSADLEIKSLYNTYHNPGLPPGPICNPGFDSLYAALHPIESDYVYYITGHDNQMHYAKTFAEHTANIAKYLK